MSYWFGVPLRHGIAYNLYESIYVRNIKGDGILRFWRCVWRGLIVRCPRCGKGKLFRGVLAMHDRCPVCQLDFEREEGFYTGAMAINLIVSELIVAAYIIPVAVVSGLNPQVPFIPILIISSPLPILLPLLLFRPARGLWLSMNYFFNPSQIER